MKHVSYIVIVSTCLLAALAVKQRTNGIFACPASGYSEKSFLAYCNTTGYGDYDRGAFLLDGEPIAQAKAGAADVLFLGSSRVQFALSNEVTTSWFAARDRSFYLMGFNATENIAFFGPLLDKLHPKARVYVLNVDGIFSDRPSWPFAEILAAKNAEKTYDEKGVWQTVHRFLCSRISICGTERAFFRSRIDGQWEFFQGDAPMPAAAVGYDWETEEGNVQENSRLARQFIDQLPVARECVILTIAPSSETPIGSASAIAKALNMELLAPMLDDLRTFDGSHLDPPSARKWTKAFLEQAGERISSCLDADTSQPK